MFADKLVRKVWTTQVFNKLNWNSKKTTLVAQRLYEGVDIDGNPMALISYPRTDSTRLSESFVKSAREFIAKQYGENYLGKEPSAEQPKVKQGANVQDAHEGIRPIDPFITPDSLKGKLEKDDLALYKLIWSRTIASLMANAKFKKITIWLENNNNKFYTFSRECEFDGFRKVYVDYEDKDDDKLIDLSNYKVGTILKEETKKVSDHQTTPPPRYTQATLIADLEKAGVGRPSTYSSMANVALDRGYAELDKRSFVMTKDGKIVIEQLEKFFPNVINKDFTKTMEEHLDKIANGEEEWKKWLQEFAPSFNSEVDNAYEAMEKVEDEKVGRNCPECDKPLVIKKARKGGNKFIGCSGWPDCKHVEPLEKPEVIPYKCPECNSDLLMRKARKGNSKFVGCSSWPKCNYIIGDKQYEKWIKENPDQPLPNKAKLEEMKKGGTIAKLITRKA